MPLGTEVGLVPGDIVLDGELGTQLPATERGTAPLHFGPWLLYVAKRSPISATAKLTGYHCGINMCLRYSISSKYFQFCEELLPV